MKSPPGRSRLVGRERELDLLREELGRATAGEFRCVVLVGEPGVGKTRLADEILARHGAASIVLSARGHALGETASFGVWAEAFESHLRSLSPDEVTARCGGVLDDLASLLRSVAALPGTATDREPPRRARLLEGLAVLLANLAGHRRVIALLDDLHWADPSSLVALRYLAHNLSSSPVLVLATARPYELAADAFGTEVLLGLEQQGLARRLEVEPIGAKDIGELASSVLDAPAPARLVDWLAERTGGNPLFAHGLLRALIEEGADLAAPRLRRLPEDLAGRVNMRLAGLDEPSRATLELLAVVGRRLELGELLGLVDHPAEPLGQVLDELGGRGLVTEDAQGTSITYEITHPVMTETIYGQLGGLRRRSLHRLVARSLVEAGRLGEAAPHYARSAEVGEAEAVEALRAAIRQAEQRRAYPELFAVLKALVKLLPAHDERWIAVFEVMDRDAIGVMEQRTDLPGVDAVVGVKAMRAIDAVLARLGDPVRRGTAKLRLANFAGWGTDEIEEAVSACRQGIDLFRKAGEVDRTLIATCQLAWLLSIGNDLPGFEATSRRVVDDAAAAGLDDILLQGLNSLGTSLCFSGRFAESEAVFRRAVTLCADDARHAYRTAWSRQILAAVLAEQGRLAEAEEQLAAARGAVPSSQHTTLLGIEASVAWIGGDYPRAVDRARLAVTLHAGVPRRRHTHAPSFAALAAAEVGLLDEAEDQATRAMAARGNRDWMSFGYLARWARAVVDWRTGREKDALASLRHLAAEVVAGRQRWVARWVLLDLVELAAQLGHPETAEAASRDLAEVVAGMDCACDGFVALGRAWSALAASRPDPDAAREAAEWLSASAFRGFHGRALYVLGRSLPALQGRGPLEEAASSPALAPSGAGTGPWPTCEPSARRAGKQPPAPRDPTRSAAGSARWPCSPRRASAPRTSLPAWQSAGAPSTTTWPTSTPSSASRVRSGRGTFVGPNTYGHSAHRHHAGGVEVEVGKDIYVVSLRAEPYGTGGWMTHQPMLSIVTKGTLTYYEGHNGRCVKAGEFNAGQAYVHASPVTHMPVNEGPEAVEMIAVFFNLPHNSDPLPLAGGLTDAIDFTALPPQDCPRLTYVPPSEADRPHAG